MGYIKILNLYKDVTILDFKECFAMEKVHGTSAHITYKDGKIELFSGGANHKTFSKLFNIEELANKFKELGHDFVVVYGEAYGGKMQGMSGTYGKELKLGILG